ncbi:MAG: AAA family ATPase [Desulfobacterales bacterium]|nr:AAA family ATPase [Desulfobacterales bacterium]
MNNGQDKNIEILIRSRYPILYIVSWEEPRVMETLKDIGAHTGKKVFEWSCSGGIAPVGTPMDAMKNRSSATRDPLNALDEVMENMEAAIYLFKDFHPFLNKNNFAIIRKLRDIAQNLKSSYKTLVLVSPFLNLPPELEKDVTVIDYNLPTLVELGRLLDRVIDDVKDNPKICIEIDAGGREEILKAARGLTLAEAENVFAKAMVTGGGLANDDVAEIYAEKRQIIRKSGLLDYQDQDVRFDHIGGLKNLKKWLRLRKLAFSDRAKRFGLPAPRGILLLGVQGCGKSLCAKAVSALWQLPLLRFDVGRLFSSLVGASEENTRRAIRIAEGVAPCVLWVDEIDKAFGSMAGRSTDSGASQRVLGTFLTWMAEKTTPVFVAATANNIQLLPPELLRKGRFDEIFFVDLPNQEERVDIFAIHLARRGRKRAKYNLTELAARSKGFSGAEIEQAVISALHEAFYQKRDLTDSDMFKALTDTFPLSKTMAEDIGALREWCATRTRPTSTTRVDARVDHKKRRLELG